MSIPKSIFRTETSLVRALKAGSEILEDINERFLTLASEMNLVFLWEQHRTKVKGFGNVYIVEQSSAAPVLPNVIRFGIAADHQGICRFADSQEPGFITVAAELRRYAHAAPIKIERRLIRDRDVLRLKHDDEVSELVKIIEGLQRYRERAGD